jgi:hypothetical protein
MEFDPVLLSRLQFSFLISFHIIFPAFTIGLAAWLTTLEGVRLLTGDHLYRRISAALLCRADRAAIRLAREGSYHHVVSYGFTTGHVDYMKTHPIIPDRTSIVGRVALLDKSVHIADIQSEPS